MTDQTEPSRSSQSVSDGSPVEQDRPSATDRVADRERGLGSRRWLTEGVLIAASPGLGYLAAFLYEWGYASQFGIPVELISLQLTSIFIAGAAVLTIVTAAFWVSDAWFSEIVRNEEVQRKLLLLSPLTLFVAAEFLLFQLDWPREAIVMAGVLALLAVLFTPGIIRKRDAQDQRSETLGAVVRRRMGPVVAVFVFSGTAIAFLAWLAGRSTAMHRETYLVPAEQPHMVVLRVYGDRFVAAPFDRETHRIGDALEIWRLQDGDRLRLRNEDVGPLLR